MKRKLIDFYPDLLTEGAVDPVASQRAAIALVRKVFGGKVGMFQRDHHAGSQRQIWVDVTEAATELDAQQQFDKWQQMKLKKLKSGILKDRNLVGFVPIFQRGKGDIGVSVVLVKEGG